MNTPTQAANAGRLYFYDYYRGMSVEYDKGEVRSKLPDATKVQRQLLRLTTDALSSLDEWFQPLGDQQFTLYTTYPGLLIGTGTVHETGAKEELILGFSFDYTTGLPVIPGSSVKGILRSAFDERAYPGYVVELLNDLLDNKLPDDFSLATLEAETFGPRPAQDRESDYPLPGQDIFHDAVPVMGKSYTSNVFGTDTITPHTAGPYKDPVPLPFLKVLPGVCYRFDLSLQDSKGFGKITAAVKHQLFRQILLDLGVGAKTNVGYGNLVEQRDYEQAYLDDDTKDTITKQVEAEKATEVENQKVLEVIQKGWKRNQRPAPNSTDVELHAYVIRRESKAPHFGITVPIYPTGRLQNKYAKHLDARKKIVVDQHLLIHANIDRHGNIRDFEVHKAYKLKN